MLRQDSTLLRLLKWSDVRLVVGHSNPHRKNGNPVNLPSTVPVLPNGISQETPVHYEGCHDCIKL
jgi:hypothetical protein